MKNLYTILAIIVVFSCLHASEIPKGRRDFDWFEQRYSPKIFLGFLNPIATFGGHRHYFEPIDKWTHEQKEDLRQFVVTVKWAKGAINILAVIACFGRLKFNLKTKV